MALPVRNAMPFLESSIRSVASQTLPDLEIVAFDDGSSDGSSELLRAEAARDPRIRVLGRQGGAGMEHGLNRAVSEAAAPVVARMDSDDVCHPERLARQLDVLDSRPEVVLVGTLALGVDSSGTVVRPRDRWLLLRRGPVLPFPHGSIMFRREAFEAVGGYRAAARGWSEVDLVLRLSALGAIAVVPEALYRYRYHAGSRTLASSFARADGEVQLMWRCLERRAAGRAYDEILASIPASGQNGKVSPRLPEVTASVARGRNIFRLWAGQPPEREEPEGSGPRALSARVRLGWHARSPETLKRAVRSVVAVRDRIAGLRIGKRQAYEWRPG